MKRPLKPLLIIIFAFLILYQIKSYGFNLYLLDRLYNQYLSYTNNIQGLLTQREIESKEYQHKLSLATQAKDEIPLADKLLSAYTKIIDNPKSTPNERIKAKESKAELLLKIGKTKQAYNLAAEILTEQPRNFNASRLLSNIAQEKAQEPTAQYDQAISEWQNILRLPLNELFQAITEFQIAHLYRSKGDYQTSLKLFQDLVNNHPYHSNWASFAQYRIVEIHHSLRDTPKVKEELTKLVTKYPYSPWTKTAKDRFKELLVR